jgi:uncharacterized protein (TIGR04255 family)
MPEDFTKGLGNVSVPGYSIKPVRFQEVQLNIAKFPETLTRNEMFGWRFESEDGARIAQLRRNGVGVSIVRDYTKWEDIHSLTRSFWELFVERAGDAIVSKVAARYINVLEIPNSNPRFEDYFVAAPRVPEELPQGVRHFFQRVEIPFEQNVIAIVIQTMDAATPTGVPLILDIDVQMTKEIPAKSLGIWTALDSLRKIKNDIFFSSLSERALGPCE